MEAPPQLANGFCKPALFHSPRFFTLHHDHSVTRHYPSPIVAASLHPVHGVSSKDLLIHPSSGVWARIFLPQHPRTKMPLVLYAHGGSYCLFGPDWPGHHSLCHRMALKSAAIWVSLGYRLAPEHRLPAAYDDGVLAFEWLQAQAALQRRGAGADPWLHEYADFSRCFLAGESAGATIAFNVAMRVAGRDWAPLGVCGLMLVQPAFHAEAKRSSMERSGGSLSFYELALPEGENLDYAAINPFSAGAPSVARLSVFEHVLVCAAERDLRYDLDVRFYELVKDLCKDVQLVISRDVGHAFHVDYPECEEAIELEKTMVEFIQSSCSSTSCSSSS